MPVDVWAALADRFAALAAEQEFYLRFYPEVTNDAYSEGDSTRFRFVFPDRETAGLDRLIALYGDGDDRYSEFDRINRLRWLAWAAGLLLRPAGSLVPEAVWWHHVREVNPQAVRVRPGSGIGELNEAARLSSLAARQLATGHGITPIDCGASGKGGNWPTIQRSLSGASGAIHLADLGRGPPLGGPGRVPGSRHVRPVAPAGSHVLPFLTRLHKYRPVHGWGCVRDGLG
jgi:hypothetical protein